MVTAIQCFASSALVKCIHRDCQGKRTGSRGSAWERGDLQSQKRWEFPLCWEAANTCIWGMMSQSSFLQSTPLPLKLRVILPFLQTVQVTTNSSRQYLHKIFYGQGCPRINFLMTWKGRKSQTSSKGILGRVASSKPQVPASHSTVAGRLLGWGHDWSHLCGNLFIKRTQKSLLDLNEGQWTGVLTLCINVPVTHRDSLSMIL